MDFKIPDEDLYRYKKIVYNTDKPLIIAQLTKKFTKKYLTQNEIKNMKKSRTKPKEYIYSVNKWNKYLDYLQKEIGNYDISKNM